MDPLSLTTRDVAQIEKRKSPGESSQAEGPKRKLPNEDYKLAFPIETSWANAPNLKIPKEIATGMGIGVLG